jgi:hypothetical protein
MASSNHGGQGSGSHSPGRGFVSVDPERQREIPHDTPRPGTPDKGSASATDLQHGVPGRPLRPTGAGHGAPQQESDDEGGSGRRYRSP